MKKNEKNEEPLLSEKDAQTVIRKMPCKFDSHDFILKFIFEYPAVYGGLLIKHKNVTTAHAEISNFLRNYSTSLRIKEKGKIESEDIFKFIRPCAQWEKMN